jgi:hypothetical protein
MHGRCEVVRYRDGLLPTQALTACTLSSFTDGVQARLRLAWFPPS